MARLFVAIVLPEYLRAPLEGLREPLPGVSWSLRENFHLTLFFVGEVAESEVDRVSEKLATVSVAPFFLPIEGLGVFPNKGHPRLIWAAVGKGHPHLFQLQHRITDTLFGMGYDPGERAWIPHITLARCSETSSEAVRQYLKKHQDFEAPPFKVTEFCLFGSEYHGGRRFYPLVRAYPLTAGPA